MRSCIVWLALSIGPPGWLELMLRKPVGKPPQSPTSWLVLRSRNTWLTSRSSSSGTAQRLSWSTPSHSAPWDRSQTPVFSLQLLRIAGYSLRMRHQREGEWGFGKTGYLRREWGMCGLEWQPRRVSWIQRRSQCARISVHWSVWSHHSSEWGFHDRVASRDVWVQTSWRSSTQPPPRTPFLSLPESSSQLRSRSVYGTWGLRR